MFPKIEDSILVDIKCATTLFSKYEVISSHRPDDIR